MKALRVLRVMRAVRVLKAAPEAMSVMNAMVTSLTSMGGFLLVWLIFMLIYALLGTRLYGGACVFELDEDAGRLSFNSFMRAMLTLFVTASGEDGFDVMHWTMEASGNSSALFMISWMIISQIILSLLLALLIDTYSVDEDEDEEGEERGSTKGEKTNKELIDMEEAQDALRREASLVRQKSDGYDDDGAADADAIFSKARGGKSGKSGKSGVSFLSMRSLERERHAEKKLAAAIESGDLTPEERAKSKSRLSMLRELREQRKVHEVAIVRQWLYYIGYERPVRGPDGSTPPPVLMTAEQERAAKDRLSLKKHFKRKLKLGMHTTPAMEARKTPFAALSVGGALRANFTAQDLLSDDEPKSRDGKRSAKKTDFSTPASPEYPDNLSDLESDE